MPSNIIQINGDEKMTWIIPDSKMNALKNSQPPLSGG